MPSSSIYVHYHDMYRVHTRCGTFAWKLCRTTYIARCIYCDPDTTSTTCVTRHLPRARRDMYVPTTAELQCPTSYYLQPGKQRGRADEFPKRLVHASVLST